MKIRFEQTGPFEASSAAEAWCEDRGIVVGAVERGQPRGLSTDACVISKWSNLAPHERRQMHGKMTGDMRHGPVTVELPGEPEDYPILPFEGIERGISE